MSKALYPYTLKPVALNMTEDEFRGAQLALFEKGASNFTLKSVRTKEWIVIGLVVAAAIAGLMFVTGYSTIIFWLMLVLVALYLVARTLGLKWYMRREYDKQVGDTKMPDEMAKVQLGVQSHGIVMSMPTPTGIINSPQMRGMQMRSAPMQSAVIPWNAVSSWDETDDYVFVMFDMKGQKGSQIIPKRLENNGLPIKTIVKHLSDTKAKGLESLTAAPR
ncbi:YcxB family protein [Moraxella nasibovis]|uniref:YcxB family protein n=1 Tax=Moraxella nasibovis TaxID=2904120 RepID=UPI0024105574|nr:YcxB family protein [Moraxella nasibovis]WFF38998.1 YcxB family protein [Moraxella nasibovis]